MASADNSVRGFSRREVEDRFILLQSLCNIPTGILGSHYFDLDSEAQNMFRELYSNEKVEEKS